MTKLEEHKYLVERSKRFYETALMQLGKGFYDLAAFSLEQSLQLFLKAHLLLLGVDYPRTHSVRKLLEIISEIIKKGVIKEDLKKYSVELGALEDAYITSRYVIRDYSREEVLRLKNVVDEVMKDVRKNAD